MTHVLPRQAAEHPATQPRGGRETDLFGEGFRDKSIEEKGAIVHFNGETLRECKDTRCTRRYLSALQEGQSKLWSQLFFRCLVMSHESWGSF